VSEHAPFSPSHGATWSVCTKAHALEQEVGRKDTSSTAALEGTYAHSIFEAAINLGLDAIDLLPAERPPEIPASVPYDQFEMSEHIQVGLDYVSSRIAETGCKVLTESKVTLTEDCWGTVDITLIGPDFIEIADLKYGRGIMVEVDDNPQLEIYTAATRWEYGPQKRWISTIIQPRIKHADGPIRSIEWEDIQVIYMEGFYRGVIDRINSGGELFYQPGEKACMWCRAKGSCRAFAEHAVNHMFGDIPMTTDAIEQQAIRNPDVLTMDERTAILRNVELCRAFLKAVEAESLEMALAGGTVDGFKIVIGGRPKRKWDLPEDEMIKKLRGMGLKVADVTTRKLCSPAAVEKVVKREKFTQRKSDNVQAHIVKGPGKKTLVPVSDNRPALATNAEQMFGDVKEK